MKYPLFRGLNKVKVSKFRLQKEFPIGDRRRYPIKTRFPFKVDVSFGKRFSTRENALRINTDGGIRNSADKITTKKLINAVGCPVMSTVLLTDILQENMVDLDVAVTHLSFPAVLKHKGLSGGREMVYIEDTDQLVTALQNVQQKLSTLGNNREQILRHVSNYFFEPYFEIHKEYRIHVSPWLFNVMMTYNIQRNRQGESGWEVDTRQWITNRGDICISQKLRYSGSTVRFRNLQEGETFFKYIFSPTVEIENYEDILNDVLVAIKAVGLDFGFADVLVDREGNWVISETGSNPGMTFYNDRPVTHSITAQAYMHAMGRIILEKAYQTNFYRPCVDSQRL